MVWQRVHSEALRVVPDPAPKMKKPLPFRLMPLFVAANENRGGDKNNSDL